MKQGSKFRKGKFYRKPLLALLLSISMLCSVMSGYGAAFAADPTAGSGATAQGTDVFSALGLDTSKIPDGFDSNTTDNPYGRDNVTANQVVEPFITGNFTGSSGYQLFGDNRSITAASVTSGTQTAGNFKGTQFRAFTAGDFSGLNSAVPKQMAYVAFATPDAVPNPTSSLLYLYFADKSGDVTAGGGVQLSGGPISPSIFIDSMINAGGQWESDWWAYLQITSGDYDGDGRDEIAVYVPDTNNPRVDVYKLKLTSATLSDPNAWENGGNWQKVWSRALPMMNTNGGNSNYKTQVAPNMVSLCSGDFNRDGVDDLAMAYGECWTSPFKNAYIQTASQALVEYGAKNGRMLQWEQNLGIGGLNLVRAAFTSGDLNGDGAKELIMGAQPKGDTDNTQRSVIVFACNDSAQGMLIASNDTVKVIDGSYQSDGNGGQIWVSNNGFGPQYYSTPYLRANLATFKPVLGGDAYLYLDSLLFSYTGGKAQLAYNLNQNHSNSNNVRDWSAWSQLPLSSISHNNPFYYEHGAVSGDVTGDSSQLLMTSVNEAAINNGAFSGIPNTMANFGGVLYNYFSDRGMAAGIRTLYGAPDGTQTQGTDAAGNQTTVNGFTLKTNTIQYTFVQAMPGGTNGTLNQSLTTCMPDTDNDTVLMHYTGNHYLKYSDPAVYAVLASAPYFSDVTAIDSSYSPGSTSYTKISGGSHSDTFTASFQFGGYLVQSISPDFLGIVQIKLEEDLAFTLNYMKATTTSQEYDITFSTTAGEDSVVFYSIPTEFYDYDLEIPDGNGGYTSSTVSVQRAYKPAMQVLSMSTYIPIQKDYPTLLPELAGKAITNIDGDPSSYPAGTGGMKNLITTDVDSKTWNRTSYGNGAISENYTFTKENSSSYSLGALFSFKAGLEVAGNGGGLQTSINLSGGWANTNLEGASYSGSVSNLPYSVQNAGYAFSWKTVAYAYQATVGGSTQTIPVITYLVTDVTAPPVLPKDFAQNYEQSTDSQIMLTWSYPGSALFFNIYKTNNYPEGGGDTLIARVPASDYTLKFDANGNPYKTYAFPDTGLGPDTQVTYKIQVERSQVPPLSALSPPLTARTKPSAGYPDLSLSTNNLLIYPDKDATVTLTVNNITDYQNNQAVYQWQKLIGGLWTDQSRFTAAAMTFSNAGAGDGGQYRCRVNVITKANNGVAISAFSDTVNVSYSKRDVSMGAIQASGSVGGMALSLTVSNPYTDSGSVPSGSVVFTLTNTNGNIYTYGLTLNAEGTAAGPANNLPRGIYKISASYMGDRVFKSADAKDIYFSTGVSSGYYIDMQTSAYYGDTIPFTLYQISGGNGQSIATPANAGAYTVTLTDAGGADQTANQAYKLRAVGTTGNSFYAAAAGTFTLKINTGGSDYVTAKVNALPRPVTLQVSSASGPKGQPPAPSISLVGSTVDNQLDDLAELQASVAYSYFDTLGRQQTAAYVSANPGYYTVTAVFSSPVTTNYNLTLLNGSYSATGPASNVTIGILPFEGLYTGKLSMASPGVSTVSDDNTSVTQVSAGTRITLAALADPGYRIADWYINGVAQGNTNNVISYSMLDQDVKIQVQFTLNSNTLSYGTAGPDGSGTISCLNGLTSGTIVKSSVPLSFTAIPAAGYHFAEWRYTVAGGGTTYPTGADDGQGGSKLTLTMPGSSISVYAAFARDAYTVTLSDPNLYAFYLGSPDGSSLSTPVPIQVKSGDAVTGDTVVTVQPMPGYSADSSSRWIVTNHPSAVTAPGGQSVTFTLKQDCTVYMSTVQNNYNLVLDGSQLPAGSSISYSLNGAAGMVFTPTGIMTQASYQMKGGQSLAVVVQYPASYNFTGWIVNQDGAITTTTSTTGQYAVPAISGNLKLTPTVAEKPQYTVSFGAIPAGLTGALYSVSLNGGDYVVAPDQTAYTVHQGDTLSVNLTGQPASSTVGYWAVDSQNFPASGAYTFTNVQTNHTIKPLAAAVGYYTVSWPTVTKAINGIDIIPQSGVVSPISAGGVFAFKVNNSGGLPITGVYANGAVLTPDGSGVYSFTVSANTEITIPFNFGVAVDGVDIGAFSGPGWRYDWANRALNLSRDGLTVSGAMTNGQDFNIIAGDAVANLILQNLTAASSAGDTLKLNNPNGTTLRFNGTVNLTNTNWSTVNSAGPLTLDGTGTLKVQITSLTGGARNEGGIMAPAVDMKNGTVHITVNYYFRYNGPITAGIYANSGYTQEGGMMVIDCEKPAADLGTTVMAGLYALNADVSITGGSFEVILNGESSFDGSSHLSGIYCNSMTIGSQAASTADSLTGPYVHIKSVNGNDGGISMYEAVQVYSGSLYLDNVREAFFSTSSILYQSRGWGGITTVVLAQSGATLSNKPFFGNTGMSYRTGGSTWSNATACSDQTTQVYSAGDTSVNRLQVFPTGTTQPDPPAPPTPLSLTPAMQNYDQTLGALIGMVSFNCNNFMTSDIASLYVDGVPISGSDDVGWMSTHTSFFLYQRYLNTLTPRAAAYTLTVLLNDGAMVQAAFTVSNTPAGSLKLTADPAVAFRGSTVAVSANLPAAYAGWTPYWQVNGAQPPASASTFSAGASADSAVLNVDSSEPNDTLTVKLILANPSSSGQTATGSIVIPVKTQAVSLEVTPARAGLLYNGTAAQRTVTFTANVVNTFNYGPDAGVTWTMYGATKTATTLTTNPDGTATLVAAPDETGLVSTGGVNGVINVIATTGSLDTSGKPLSKTAAVTIGKLVISNPALPNGAVGIDYDQTLTVQASAPVTWSVTGGTLPAGLQLNQSTGSITGRPTAVGSYTFAITATDNVNSALSDTKEFTVVIYARIAYPVITTASLPDGTVGMTYSQTLTATGDAPITWTIGSGSLPEGLSLSSAGVISGRPVTAGASNFTVKAANQAGSAARSLAIQVGAIWPVTSELYVLPPTVTIQRGSNQQFNAFIIGAPDQDQTVTWSVYGNDDANTRISSAGLLTVAPSEGAAALTVTATSVYNPALFGTSAVTLTNDTVAPTIFGPTSLTLTEGYGATSTGVYTVTGSPTPTVAKTSGDPAITWNDANRRLDIAPGLTANSYPVTLTAGNGTLPDGLLTFILNLVPMAQTTYGLAVTAGAGGSVAAGANGSYVAGAVVNIVASPEANYRFNGWTSSAGGVFADASSSSTTFTMPAQDVTVTASFEALPATVTSVTNITGVPGTATAGTSLTLTGTVVPANATNQTIVWSVVDAGTTGATVSGNTLNTVSAGTVNLRATIVNGTAVGTDYTQDFTVAVNPASAVTGVTVTPLTSTVPKGTTKQFAATVTGTGPGSINQSVIWSVYGNNDSGTAISATGLLNVATGETATSLTVKATSTVDNAKSGAAVVTVTNIPPATYALTLQAGAGGVTAGTGGDYEAGTVINITAFANSGYKFSNWTTSNGGNFGDANSASTTFTMPGNPTTVTANFSAVGGGGSGGGGGGGGGGSNRIVSFNTNGGSAVNSQTVADGAKAVKPADPVKEGYTFSGWYTDQGLTTAFDFTKVIIGNITLYAKWTQSTPVRPPDKEPTDNQWQNPFRDVQSTDWFYGDVQYVFSNNLFKGVSDTAFAPNGPITRAMFVTVLWRAAGSPTAGGSSPFKDVAAGAYYTEAVNWAAQHNIVLGISSTLFAPNRQVTREQMAAILYRYEQFSGSTPPNTVTDKQFADANKISDYAKNPVKALVAQGIIGGKPGNLFDPQGTTTRAEVAALLHRFMAAVQ